MITIEIVTKPCVNTFNFKTDSALSRVFNTTRDKDIDHITDQYYRWFWDRVNMGYDDVLEELTKLEDRAIKTKHLKLSCPYRAQTVKDYLVHILGKKGYTSK